MNKAIQVSHEGIFINTLVIILEAVLTFSFWWNQKKAKKPTQKYLRAGNKFHLLTFIYVTYEIIQLIWFPLLFGSLIIAHWLEFAEISVIDVQTWYFFFPEC